MIQCLSLPHYRNKTLYFSDGTTIYSCSANYNDTNQKLTIDVYDALNWFRLNNMVGNPVQFQIMFLGSKIDITITKLIMKNGRFNSHREVKLLGTAIGGKLLFKNDIYNLWNIQRTA